MGYEHHLQHAAAAQPGDRRLLVLANGTARRGEKAPGHLDPRSFAFDKGIEAALAEGNSASLAALDADLGRELLAAGIEPLPQLSSMCLGVVEANVLYAEDPYCVRYWVATWLCASGVS